MLSFKSFERAMWMCFICICRIVEVEEISCFQYSDPRSTVFYSVLPFSINRAFRRVFSLLPANVILEDRMYDLAERR